MSHELRTPLNSLLVLAEQLEDNPQGNLSETEVGYAHVIRGSGNDLLKLLNDVLDLAKVESNTVKLEPSEISLEELCQNLQQSFDPLAEAEGLSYSVSLDSALPASMVTDPHRLRQVLKNLLSNAFKFTTDGGISLGLELSGGGWSAERRRLADADSVVAITVTDTGIGIKPEMQTTIFEAFAQGDGSTARQYGGTGLGLSISRDLVDLLGGELTLESVFGEGSSFTVYLPIGGTVPAPVAATSTNGSNGAVASEAALATSELTAATNELTVATNELTVATHESAVEEQAVAQPAVEEPVVPPDNQAFYSGSAAGSTVLVVDDDFRNIFALTALLERGELNVVSAESGGAALTILDQRNDIDLILMDIMMPVMNGYETMAEIRKRPGLAEMPIIAVTGKVVGGERERCLAAGASDYIPKPVDTAELLSALGEWFPAKRKLP
jgi:CheY-like chemotaxis protein